ncbi:MAG: alkaline phosphatase family protein [Bacteroidota bacterium]
MNRILLFTTLLLGLISCEVEPQSTNWVVGAPAGERYAQINPQGETIIPNGRVIKPYGNTLRIAPHPFGLALSPDGTYAITANSGTRPFSISVIKDVFGQHPQVKQIPEGALNNESLLEAVFMGLAVTPDNKKVYVAGGTSNKVFVFDLETGAKLDSVDGNKSFDGRDYTDGYLGDMALSSDGKRLFVLDQIGFRMMVIDTETMELLANIPTGRYPFGICLSPDGKKAYIANVGVFEYKKLEGLEAGKLKEQGLKYPAYAYQSQEAKEGAIREGKEIPALGDANVNEAFSVWAIDLEKEEVVQKIKTGILVGEMVEGIPAVGGASPNSVVATDKYVFVSNGNNDLVSVLSLENDSLVKQIKLSLDDRMASFRGMIPFGLALSPDQKTLFVAESGVNAVAVIDVESQEVKGHIPTAWFPSKVEVSPDGKKLLVTNAKGYGSGPNGGKTFEMGPEGSYIGSLMKGSVTIMDIPNDEKLIELSKEVVANNFTFYKPENPSLADRKNNPIPLLPNMGESPIEHIIFISKENRTYDEVFGQLKKGKGDPSLARYGLHANFTNNKGEDSVRDCDVMVNHMALARRFAISDNFYCDSDHSADGHRWLVNTYPNEWVETHTAAAYGGKRRAKADSKAPGNLGLVGSTGAIYPEDYNEAGSIWDHFGRNDISFFNFGFGVEMAGTISDSTMKYTGIRYLVNFPVPGPLYDHSSRHYPTYNMAIPDQFRVDQFLKEWDERNWSDGKSLPQVLTVLLPNDHGAGDRPHAGYPYRESYMMDNDLALGRLVEFLSHTPYWKKMAIVVTMDDSQNGVDHVDAHRSLLMVISPYAKRDYVSHTHYSFGSIFKTFWNILGIPYQNQYDAGASDMGDMFTSEPDYRPYLALPVDERAFDPQKVLDPFDETFDWEAVIKSPDLDDPEVLLKEMEAADKARDLERNKQSNPLRDDE